jgi:D-alanyl-D-alanine dipeptidase
MQSKDSPTPSGLAHDDELAEAVESPVHEAETESEARPVINDYGEPVSRLVEIAIEDNGEPLVDIFAVCPALRWAEQSPRFDFPRSGLARVTVAEMLKRAQRLLPSGLHWQIVGAFRPFAIQKAMYQAARAELAAKHPDWDEELLTEYINVFSAPPIWDTPPPHTTGGAVDLSIIDDNGERLDMVSPHEIGWDSAPTDVDGLSPTARSNRAMMVDILNEAGLTNFPGEWWHWSWGEPGWALRTGRTVALYGAVPEDQIPDWTPPS